MDFHKTTIGKKFYTTDFPRAISALETIASSLATIAQAEKNKEKTDKLEKIKENKSNRKIKAVLEKNKNDNKNQNQDDLKLSVIKKKISDMKDSNGHAFFDEDFLKKMFNENGRFKGV